MKTEHKKADQNGRVEETAAAKLASVVDSQLEHVIDGERRGLKAYKSLRNLDEVIGTQYGNRVLYELIQNAHDAHSPDDQGRIAIKLVVDDTASGTLYVANGGNGFTFKDVDAIRNLAASDKEVGEGIGNKGLGFRSIEALTNDVRIYSQPVSRKSKRFDGYCFRFAGIDEIKALLESHDMTPAIRRQVAKTIPKYLLPLPLKEQPGEVVAYAQRGFATVVVLPLRSVESIALATEQVKALSDLDVPLLLFLYRIGEIRIDMYLPGQEPNKRVLRRRQKSIGDPSNTSEFQLYEVGIGERRRFLVVRRVVDKKRVLEAVERSIPMAPQLKRWRVWKGDPVVSIAVGLGADGVTDGRLYNFLPMGKTASAPVIGYLDAPFFTDIDRRNADLRLPLNETLLEAAAEACAASALSIVDQGLSVSPQAVFDLFAWTGDQAKKFDNALTKAGSSLGEARVVPAISANGQGGWSSLSEIYLWPEGKFAVLKAQDMARHVGAQLVSSELDDRRVRRLTEVAKRTFRSLSPSGQRLANWAEEFARSLVKRKVSPLTWSRFYEDLNRVFEAGGTDLAALAHKLILFDRSGKLRPADIHGSGSRAGVYVRGEALKGKRSIGGIPLPPVTLTRRYRFLNEKIKFRREALNAYVEANLLREYDPLEALAGLKSALGKKPNDNRRREALVWAFQVWRAAGAQVDDVLPETGLHVPTLSGWQPAAIAAFSSSWTSFGRTLENYLVETAELSADCRRARRYLLIGHQDWPGASNGTKRQWHGFLDAIGVADGLRPRAAALKPQSSSGYFWNIRLRHGNASEGLDKEWCAEVASLKFNHRDTHYEMRDEAWRLPGQIEYDQLSETAREAFCTLIFGHLKTHGDTYFRFEVGRFSGRPQRDWDLQTLPTPLATFLRSKQWISATTRDGMDFRRPDECWAGRVQRGGPPRFFDRVPEITSDLVASGEYAEFMFSAAIGLRDWQDKETAVERLVDLAAIVTDLASNDRPAFRREYQRAWLDVAETKADIPAKLKLAITSRGQFEELTGDTENPTAVVVTQDAQRFEARVLSTAGYRVLEVGDTSTEHVAALLEATSGFAPLRLDGLGVQLLLDGAPFVPSATDPFLISFGLDWLPEVLVIGHELRGEQLEKGIRSSTVERRARSIRARYCDKISLVVDGQEISPNEDMLYYAFEHDDLPTLILTSSLSLGWTTLGYPLSAPISRLIDTRLRSPEPLLLKLALDSQSEDLDAPSDDSLARALGCDVQTIQDHRLALRTDLGRVLHLLLPVTVYYGGVDMAKLLRTDADRAGLKFDPRTWLAAHLDDCEHTPEELVQACEQTGDRAEIRRMLGLDYGVFNQALLDLGEPPLSNETELRQLYDAYLAQMRTEIIDRLRRHHYDDFLNGRELDLYVERKSLAFLAFNQEWVLTHETLEQTLIEGHVSSVLEAIVGEDSGVELAPLKRILAANRKSALGFSEEAASLILVWCQKHGEAVPTVWQSEEPQAVVRHVENEGLLDFQAVDSEQMPFFCRRAGCWPNGMAETLERTQLDLEQGEIEEEEKRREKERRQAEIAKRSIEFGGKSLDTGDATFSDNLRQIAERWLSEDETWFERSRQRVRLATLQDLAPHGGGGGGGKGKGRRKLSDAHRTAMGLASEWLAYQFLLRRHVEYVNEDCWISENRAQFLGGSPGDDSAGYDFLVKTPQADWFYEVKSSLEDSGEFELTANELRIAGGASKDGRRRYRILYVPYVFSPNKWYVLELPNPMGERTRNQFQTIGRGSVRMRFERR